MLARIYNGMEEELQKKLFEPIHLEFYDTFMKDIKSNEIINYSDISIAALKKAKENWFLTITLIIKRKFSKK